jgi:hypothetical protein
MGVFDTPGQDIPHRAQQYMSARENVLHAWRFFFNSTTATKTTEYHMFEVNITKLDNPPKNKAAITCPHDEHHLMMKSFHRHANMSKHTVHRARNH